MTAKEAAVKLEVSLSLLYQLIQEKRIRHRRIGGRNRRGAIRIDEDAIEAFKEECSAELEND